MTAPQTQFDPDSARFGASRTQKRIEDDRLLAGKGLYSDDRVFERFYRTDTSRNRRTGGSGLGLSIVAALVAAHGGKVDVKSAPGAGATFRVRLPGTPVG